jgi:endonuclease-3
MLTLEQIVEPLAGLFGEPVPYSDLGLLELVLLENVAYLVDDEQRWRAFRALETAVGLEAEQILAASDDALNAVAGHGILAAHQAEKLRRIAGLVIDEFGGNLESIRALPLAQAKKALMRFPGIGEPGAEKILLLARSHPVLGLDSNGVRVLTRLGVIKEGKSYAATYRAVQAIVQPYSSKGFDWLIRAYRLLRQHGQELCRRSRPQCEACSLNDVCAYYAAAQPTPDRC